MSVSPPAIPRISGLLSKEFNQETAKRMLSETKRLIKWLKQQLKSDE